MINSRTNFLSRNQLDQPGPFLRLRVPRGFDAEAKVERNGMRSGEQNRCLGFREA